MSWGRRRKYTLGLAGVFILMWGAVWSTAQNQPPAPPSVFTLKQLIGRAQPRDLRYDAQYDRFAWINPTGQLAIADAATYEELAVLTPNDPGTSLNDYRFSPDGKWLAVARDKRIDLWDVQTLELAAEFETDSTLGLEGPLWFSDDGRQLVFQSRVPAPQSTRRSENDTDLIPWVWDTFFARGVVGRSELPNGVIAQPMFDYRNGGFILGKGKKVVAGLPSRLRTVELKSDSTEIIDEAEDPQRIEVDPIDAWVSEADGWMLIRTQTGELVQIDPTTGQFLPVAVNRSLQMITQQTVDSFHLSSVAQPIGPIGDTTQNPLRARLIGDEYRSDYGYDPITMYLLDVLEPITPTAGVPGLLIYTRNDRTGQGMIEFLTVPNSRALSLHPNGRQLLIQEADGNQTINVYNIGSGTIEQVYHPGQLDADVVDYKGDGSALVVGLERFNTRTQDQTFYDPEFFTNASQIFFSQDSQTIITLDNGSYQQWDVATGQLLRQDFYYARGEIVRTAPDGTRMLTRLDMPTGQTLYEVVDVAGNTRPTLTIALPLNTTLLGVYPDDTWDQFFVLVGDNNSTRPESRIQGAFFRMGSSAPLWVVGNGDLPNDISNIQWIDANTLAFEYVNQTVPAPRIENIQYAASGLPTCLVDGLPDAGMRWLGLWDFFNQTRDATGLDQLTVRLCQIVQDADSPASADAALEAVLLSPTPAPTDIFGTPRPARIPGVPDCITQRFTSEALKYAQDWRTITETMTDAQIAELARLVCEGLTGDSAPQIGSGYGDSGFVTRHLTVDVNTLARVIHNGTVPQLPAGPDPYLVADAWRREKRFEIGNFALSPDGQMVAVADGRFISIYSISPVYEGLAATATATFLPQGTPEKRLSVRPTATPPAQIIQATLMPTLTPTWTPTNVPLPIGTPVPVTEIEETCPTERIPLASLSLTDRPQGTMFVELVDANNRYPWQFDLSTGKLRLRDDIPSCDYQVSCSASPDNQWILYHAQGSTWVSRWDGTGATELFSPLNTGGDPISVTWVGPHTLEWSFQEYQPETSMDPVTLEQRFDAATGVFSEAAKEENQIPQINNLSTGLVTRQPIQERYDLLSVPVRGGQRYYWHDRTTGDISLFLTLSDSESLRYEWQPGGKRFYYGTSGSIAYVYDPATKRSIPSSYFSGLWSPDARKSIDTYIPTAREEYDYEQANRELPRLVIWDAETNTRTRYCLPGTDRNQGANIITWSPDSRYVLVQASLVLPDTYEVSRPVMLILDTETGHVIDLGTDIESVTTWTTGGAQ